MMEKIQRMKLIKEFIYFLIVSGTGWLIDFGLFYILSSFLGLNVLFSNLISTIPAFTFVFLISTRKIFRNNIKYLTLQQKYLVYFTYQFFLVISVSLLGQWLYGVSHHSLITYNFSDNIVKFCIKIIITPITMILNFFTMKLLTEKL